MAEINHRYLKDNDGDAFFPITHIDAVQGFDQESTDNALTDINDKISQVNTLITDANTTISAQQKIIEAQQSSINEQKKTLESQQSSINEQKKTIDTHQTSITEQKKIIDENSKLLNAFDVAIGDMVGDTGWVDITIPSANKNNANTSGFKSGIREVRTGNNLIPHRFVLRSIRLNVSNITGQSMQIAQLPTGFITDNQSFMARQNGYRNPITIECLKDGRVMAFVHPDDQSKTNWVYQEFTWLE